MPNQQSERIYLLDVEALDADNQPQTLRFSSAEYLSDAGVGYLVRLKQPALLTVSAFTSAVIQTKSRSAFGEAVLLNTDGGLDYLVDYAIDGRNLTLSLVDENEVLSVIFTGTAERFSYEENQISLRIRDFQETLQVFHPNSIYAGTNILPNGVEGVASDIKGSVKPQVFGIVNNLEPVLVNTTKLIYQAHDSTINPDVSITISKVYDRGIELSKGSDRPSLDALQGTSPAPGFWDSYLGYIRLGSLPTGQVTIDCNTNKTKLGDIFQQVASTRGFTCSDQDISDLNATGSAGYYLNDSIATSDILDQLALSGGAYWSFLPTQEILVKKLQAPVAPDVYIDDSQIISITRDRAGSGSNGLPLYAVTLLADKIETVQSDLAAAVPTERKSRLALEYRESFVADLDVQIRNRLAEELILSTSLTYSEEALQEAQRLLDLLKVRRDSLVVEVRVAEEVLDSIQIGKTVNVQTYKLGYSQGKNFIVLGYTLDARISRLALELWG